jgi:hypothetical protein
MMMMMMMMMIIIIIIIIISTNPADGQWSRWVPNEPVFNSDTGTANSVVEVQRPNCETVELK